MLREEALQLFDEGHIRAAAKYNDLGFNSFFRRGWKRFYVKWYDEPLDSAKALCPKTVALVQSIPSVNAAMFALLPPGGDLGKHRDPFAGSLRYHLGLSTPNSENCRIFVDGEPYSWRDGEAVIFDETFIHWAENKTDTLRVILFCDVERPLTSRIMATINHWYEATVIRASQTENVAGDQVGVLNKIFGFAYYLRLPGKALKRKSKFAYYVDQVAAARRPAGLDTRLMFARALFTAAVLALALLGAEASAQEAYPSKPITLVVPFPPGGVADIVARPAADALGRVLGAPVVIENKAGAGGGIGMAYVAKAKPDGYTLLLALSSISILPEADKIIGRPPMYQLDQLVPIARLTADPTVLAVRADSPWKTLQEFVADAKKRPGAISYGSSGNYGTMHVPMEMFAGDAGIKMLHVPYTGAGPAVVGLLGGNIDAVASGPSTVIQHVKAGKVRVLASWGDHRLASLPDVPTLSESGFNAVFFQWSGLFAPAGTPAPVLAKLRDAARITASDPRFVAALATVETPVQYLDAPELQRFWDADAQKLGAVVRRVGKLD